MTQKEEERGGRESLCCFLPSPSNKIAIQPLPLLLSFSPPPFSPLLKTCFSPFSSPSDPPFCTVSHIVWCEKWTTKNHLFYLIIFLKLCCACWRKIHLPHALSWIPVVVIVVRDVASQSSQRSGRNFPSSFSRSQKHPFFVCQEQPPSPSLTSGELEGGIKWNLTLCSSFTISFHWPYGPFSCSKSFKA